MACFQNQTYPNRELLILADGERVDDLIPPDDRIRLVHLDGHPEIGEKRNIGCELAGELIAHWDDDDFSAPERLADQVQRLRESGKAVTGYYSMRFVREDGRAWLYRGGKHYGIGTSFLYRRDWWALNKFPMQQIGEDNDFIGRAYMHGVYIGAEAGELMEATIHAGNTSPRDVSGWQKFEL